MAETQQPVAPEGNRTGGDLFTANERAYFDSRGETAIPAEPAKSETKPEPAPVTEASQPSEPVADAPAGDEARKVNYGALAQERNERRKTEEKLRQAELWQARAEERFRAMQQYYNSQQPQPTQPQQPPSPDQDIFGAVKHVMQVADRNNAEIEAYKRQQAAAVQAGQYVTQLGTWAAARENEFRQQTPDYQDALKHLRTMRLNELQRTWGLNEAAAAQQLVNEERGLLQQAASQRRNPAQVVYEIAKQRGWRQSAPAQDPSKQLDTIAAGQQASRSLSNVGGRSGGGHQVTLEELVKMSNADFAAFKERNPAKYRRLKGAPS